MVLPSGGTHMLAHGNDLVTQLCPSPALACHFTPHTSSLDLKLNRLQETDPCSAAHIRHGQAATFLLPPPDQVRRGRRQRRTHRRASVDMRRQGGRLQRRRGQVVVEGRGGGRGGEEEGRQ